jgi:hypothetical protein
MYCAKESSAPITMTAQELRLAGNEAHASVTRVPDTGSATIRKLCSDLHLQNTIDINFKGGACAANSTCCGHFEGKTA